MNVSSTSSTSCHKINKLVHICGHGVTDTANMNFSIFWLYQALYVCSRVEQFNRCRPEQGSSNHTEFFNHEKPVLCEFDNFAFFGICIDWCDSLWGDFLTDFQIIHIPFIISDDNQESLASCSCWKTCCLKIINCKWLIQYGSYYMIHTWFKASVKLAMEISWRAR